MAGGLSHFELRDMGLTRQLGYYHDFIMKTDFRSSSPAPSLVNAPNLCFANPGLEYVVYAPSGGNITLDLAGATSDFSVEWLNPREGAYQIQGTVSGGSSHTFNAPDTNDWVLHLKKTVD